MRAGISLIAALALGGAAAHAGMVTPIEYRMPNGEGQLAGGWVNYWDDTYSGFGSKGDDLAPLTGGVGQLTDGILGHTNWWGDKGNGPSWEWVAWTTINPTILFRFDQPYQFDRVSLHLNNSTRGAVTLPSRISYEFSPDGVNFSTPSVFTPSPSQYTTYGGRWQHHSVAGAGSYVRVNLTRTGGNWVFLSEVEFSGTPIPAPGALALLCGGLALMTPRRRR